MIKRGLFGCDLKQQVTVIALTYCCLSILGISFGFLLYLHPEKFAKTHEDTVETQVSVDVNIEADLDPGEDITTSSEPIYEVEDLNKTQTAVGNNTAAVAVVLPAPISNSTFNEDPEDILEDIDSAENVPDYDDNIVEDIVVNETEADKKKIIYGNYENDLVLKYYRNEGVEAIVASFLKLACSVLLYHGIRNNKHILFLPWLVEESIEMIGGFIFFVIQHSGTQQWKLSSFLFGLLFYVLGGYFLYSTGSYYNLVRRRNINSTIIVQSVSQGEVSGGHQNGMNYQRLEEECWQSEPNLASEIREVRPLGSMDSGFIREKKVADTEDNDEHVLYVQ